MTVLILTVVIIFIPGELQAEISFDSFADTALQDLILAANTGEKC